ncbi:MAG: hypothetical protein E7562_04325 [Ruminococcaceae bacterium]|nr:hypothetical protein [Oscillospiraceae bacterium]
MKNFKKLVSLILSVILMLSVLPINVFAMEENSIVSISISDTYVCDGTQDMNGKFVQFSFMLTQNYDGGAVGSSMTVDRNSAINGIDTEFGTLYLSDNQDDEPWEVGNTYQVAATVGNLSTTFNVTVLEIESIEVEDVELVENNNGYMEGYWDIDNNYSEWFRYYVEPDNITVNFTNGMSVSGYTSEIQNFIGVYPQCYSDQSFENQWGIGEHSATLKLAGFEVEYTVIIKESPVRSIDIKDVTVYENIGGYKTENGYYYYINPFFDVTFADGSKLEGCQHNVYYDGKLFWFDVETNQYNEPWSVGNTYTATAVFAGKSYNFNVTVAENPIERIDIKDITLYDGIHNSYGEYNLDPNFDVVLKDGTVYKDDKQGIDINGTFVSLECTYDQENWKVGNTYSISGELAGVTDTFNVTIKENPIESIEFTKLPKTEYITGEFFNMRHAELRINYKDGEYEDIIIDECMYDFDYIYITSKYLKMSDYLTWYEFSHEIGKQTVTLNCFGTELEIDVNVSKNLAESAELKVDNDDLVITVKNSDGSSYDLKIVQSDIRFGGDNVIGGWFFAENMIFEAAVYCVYDEDSKTYTDVSFELMNFADEALKTNKVETSEWLKMYDKANNIYWGIYWGRYFGANNELIYYTGEVTKENINVIMSTAAYLEYGYYMADIELEDGNYYGEFTADEIRIAVYKHYDIDYIDLALSDKYDSEKDIVYVSSLDADGSLRRTLNKHANNWYMEFFSYDNPKYYVLCGEDGRIKAFDTKPLIDPKYGYITDSGEYENIYWQYFEETETLKISGKGEIPSFTSSYLAQPWYLYKNKIKKLVINGDFTAVGENAFSKLTALSNVEMPDSVQFIKSGAFADCVALSEIVLPKNIKEIYDNSFDGCKKLSLVKGLENVLSIGENAFKGCALSGTICLNKALYVESNAFSGCDNIEAVKYGFNTYTDISSDNLGDHSSLVYITYGSPVFYNTVFDNITYFLIGDLSGDGDLSADDIVGIRKNILGISVANENIADLNLDGKSNVKDLVKLKKIISGI